MNDPVLTNLDAPPKAAKYQLYRWCDYIELRCLTHRDKRFSRDSLIESIDESIDTSADNTFDEDADILIDVEDQPSEEGTDTPVINDKHEEHAAGCFKHLRWRQTVFGDQWPFRLDEDAQELSLKTNLDAIQEFYLSLLLSASLAYTPKKYRRTLTGLFEKASCEVMKRLMPQGAEIHAFGAADSTRYQGHLFDRLTTLCLDVRAKLIMQREHFASRDTGDGGLDIVAWHGLADDRPGIPIAFGQCGCTADGWPNKMLEASPGRLSGTVMSVLHPWATYYFMPLDLSTEIDRKMDWQRLSDFSQAIVIDRLRFVRLSREYEIPCAAITANDYVRQAIDINRT